MSVLKDADINRVAEIKDELEALSAEKQLYSSSRASSGGREINAKATTVCSPELLRDVVHMARSSTKQAGSYEEGLGGAVSYLVTAVLQEKVRYGDVGVLCTNIRNFFLRFFQKYI